MKKKKNLPSLSDNGAQIWSSQTCTQKNKEVENNARSSMLPCSLGLTGYDPQEGTAIEALGESSS